MTLRTKVEIVGGVVLLALALLYGWEALRQHEAVLVAQTKADSDRAAEAKTAELQKQLDGMKAALDSRQKQQDAALAKMTTPQIVVKLPEYVPQATAPVKVLDANSAAVKAGEAKVGDVLTPQEDVHPIAEKLLHGQQCSDQLGLCQQKLVASEDQVKLKSDEADQWKTAARGGSIWKRVKHDAVIIGVAAGVAYAAGRLQK